jgi:hypothetical protein
LAPDLLALWERIGSMTLAKGWLKPLAAAAAVTVGLVLAAPAQAAAPNYILVSGRGLAHPALLADWRQNMKLLLAVANAPRARGRAVVGLSGRPRLDLAEFWAWLGRARPTSPAQASQHGSFYPAHGSKPAVIVLTVQGITVPRLAPAFVLTTFTRHGIRTRS